MGINFSYKNIFITFIIGATVAMIALVSLFFLSLSAPDHKAQTEAQLVVKKGTGVKSVASDLKDKGLVKNSWSFVLYTYLTSTSSKIIAGTYLLSPSMDAKEILSKLTGGQVQNEETSVTIIEGWSNNQLATALELKGYYSKPSIQKALTEEYSQKIYSIAKRSNLEGFLFPDTYKVKIDDGPHALIDSALNNFEKKFTPEIISAASDNGLSTYELVVLASIIEKEVGRNTDKALDSATLALMQKERQLVASVFYNRLKIGMPLQSDATVNYITGKKDRQVLLQDANIDSKYNTYKYAGLPPGPIGNPGLGSLNAAAFPAESDFFYFLNTTDGTAIFSKTLDEHNANKIKYLD